MWKRVTAAILAVLTAFVVAFGVMLYTAGADRRAISRQRPVSVVVVTAEIKAGEPASSLQQKLALRDFPEAAVAPDAFTSIQEVLSLSAVSATDIAVGEQLIHKRLVRKTALGQVPAPKGFQEVSFTMPADRMVGGRIHAGSKVGIVVTMTGKANDGADASFTTMTMSQVLVTHVDPTDGSAKKSSGSNDDGSSPSAGGAIVTVALRGHDVERLVFSMENGKIWLTLQPDDVSNQGLGYVRVGDVRPA